MQLLRPSARRIVFGACVSLLPIVAYAQPGPPAHTIALAVTDCWGSPVNAAAIIVQPSPQRSAAVRLSYPSEREIHLKSGEYAVSIVAKGFFPLLSHLSVGETNSEFRTCLELAPIEGTRQPFSKLNVRTAPDGASEETEPWVRIISLFSDLSLSSKADKRGYCSFPPIPSGKYLAFLMKGGDIKAQKLLEIREKDESVLLP